MFTWDQGWQAELPDEAATCALAAHLAAACRPGQGIALVGEMGAGKTTLVRGLAIALGTPSPSEVSSPTYALMHEYPTAGPPLVHVDLWRLDGAAAAAALGLDEALERKDAVVVVEWAERAWSLLPAGSWGVRLAAGAAGGRLAWVVGAPPRGPR